MTFEDFVPQQRFQQTLAISPDGTRVAYSANTSGRYEAWVVPLDGSGTPSRITELGDRAVRAIAWSPDGERFAITADTGGDEQHQIFVIDRDGSGAERVTTADDRQHELGSSPFSQDGRWLAYAGNDRDPSIQDVVLHDLETGEQRRVESEPGALLGPVAFSPDDSRLLVVAARSNTDGDACMVDLTRSDLELEVLTTHVDEAMNAPIAWTEDGAGCYVLSDRGGEYRTLRVLDVSSHEMVAFEPAGRAERDIEGLATSRDGSVLAWVANAGGVSVLHRYADGESKRVEVPDGVIDTFEMTPDGGAMVMLHNTAARPTDVVVVDLGPAGDASTVRYLTDSRPAGLRGVEPIEPELVEYPTHDGRSIPGWLYRPAGDGPFPIVLSIHGGPEAQERPTYAYAGLYQSLLASGVGVFAPNVRGSSGYGRTYQMLIHRDWGGAELGDFEHANRYLRSLDWVDGDRIAVFGGSFGGFATLSCVARLPDLWAAGVSIVGPSNLHTFVTSVPPTWRALMATWVGDPERDADLLTERSPLTYADDIIVPLFVIQGANDPRVAQAESDQIVESLQARGVEVRYDVYPDEGHGFTKRENEIKALGDISDFLVGHLR